MKRILLVSLSLFLFLFSVCGIGYGQERGGILPSGLGYIIHPNTNPQHKVELRLIYKIGSLVETNSERGYAHFLEHLAFGGTEHFPARSLVEFVESRGTRYGVGLNAFTGYDRTIYMLSLPLDSTESTGVIDSALLILHDWLYGISLDSVSIARERGIIRQEIRSFVEQDPFYQLKIGRGIQSRRLPVADLAAVDSVTLAPLQSFYRRWYRPALATILIVGDVDAPAVERQLRKLFSSTTQSPPERPRPLPLEYKRGITIHTLADSLERSASLDMITPLSALHSPTPKALAEVALWRIATEAISARLGGWTRGAVSRSWYLGDTDHLNITLEASNKKQLLHRLQTAFAYLRELERRGISTEEFDSLRQSALSRYPVLNQLSSETWCNYYIDHLLMGDLLITDQDTHQEVKQVIESLQKEQLRPLFRQIINSFAQVTLAAYSFNPESGKKEELSERDIKQAIRRGLKSPAPRYRFTSKSSKGKAITPIPTPALLDSIPPLTQGGEIVQTQYYKQLQLHEYRLANGLRLVLKPMPRAEGVKVSLLAPGGYATIPHGKEALLEGVAGYMEMGLINGIPSDSLQEYMYTNELSLSLIPSPYHYGVMASTTKVSLKPLLNLIRLKITQPALPYQDFQEIRDELYTQIGQSPTLLSQRLERNPSQRMERIIDSLMGGTIYLDEPKDSLTISRLDLDSIALFHQSLLRGTEDMTLIISGQFDLEPSLGWIQQIFGSLPRAESLPLTRNGLIPPAPKQISLEEGQSDGEPTTVYQIAYGSYPKGLRGSLSLKLMRELLRNRMIKYLRTETGLIYTPYLSVYYRSFPSVQAYFVLEYSVAQQQRERSEGVMQQLIEELQQTPASEQELEDIRRTFLVNKREALTETDLGAWQNALIDVVKYEEGLESFDNYERVLRSISAEELRLMFESFFTPDHSRRYYIGKSK